MILSFLVTVLRSWFILNLPYKKKQPERFALRVYDPTFSLIWERDISLPYNDEFFEVADQQIDNNGNVYLLGIAYQGKGRKGIKDGAVTYKYTILGLSCRWFSYGGIQNRF